MLLLLVSGIKRILYLCEIELIMVVVVHCREDVN